MCYTENSLATIYMVRYSESLTFYWTIGGNSKRIPLIKHGSMFVPVMEHHTLIILAAKIVEIAELRIDGKYVDSRESEQQGFQGMLFGNESYCPLESEWSTVIFGGPNADFKFYRDRTKKELIKLLSQH